MASATPKVCGVNIVSPLKTVGITISLNHSSRLPYNANHGARANQTIFSYDPAAGNGEISSGFDVGSSGATTRDAGWPVAVAQSRHSVKSRSVRSRARQH